MALELRASLDVYDSYSDTTGQILFDNDQSELSECEQEAVDEYERYQMSEEDSWRLFEEFVESIGILHHSDSFEEIYPELRCLKVSSEEENDLFI